MDMCKLHFCKHMDGFYVHSICLPEKVMIHFIDLAGKLLVLRRPTGKVWHVGLIKDGERLVLLPGWHDFVSDNDVSQSDLLVFKCVDEATFEVLIFDQSGSERSFRTEKESYGSTPNVSNDNDSNWRTPATFPDQLPDCDLPANEGNRWRKRDKMTTDTETPCLTSNENSGKRTERADGASNSMVLPRQMSNEVKLKAQKLHRQVQPRNPSFAVVIERYQLSHYLITIPSTFRSEHLPRQHQEVALRLDGGKRTWLAKYACRRRRQDMSMYKFVRDNDLQLGDICLFEIVEKGNHATFNVYISRNYQDALMPMPISIGCDR